MSKTNEKTDQLSQVEQRFENVSWNFVVAASGAGDSKLCELDECAQSPECAQQLQTDDRMLRPLQIYEFHFLVNSSSGRHVIAAIAR